MNELTVFNYESSEVRTLEIDGEPWFVGKDVAEILGYSNTNEVIQEHIDTEDKLNSKTLLSCDLDLGQRGGWLINESGLYSLILSSKMPNAKKFKRWITSEVLPSLRKTGSYSMERKPLSPAEMFKLQAELNYEHEQKLKALEAKQEATDRKITEVANAFTVAPTNAEEWAEAMNRNINEMVEEYHLSYGMTRGKLYDQLELIADVDLTVRQTRLRNRMKQAGATKTQQNAVSKLHIIAQDKKLRAILEGIVKAERARLMCEKWAT